ncbi:type I secretion system permease/ATPase [Comamonas sp. w2-DMI]|uniref:type I secretion system permease/ATPase n=1 Tax=Comamonas sp. w2-DMI TaxID=3126391 RepID=UPI0032E3DF7A
MRTNQSEDAELRAVLAQLRPYFVRTAWFSVFSAVLVLAPSGYMLEVYDRVVNSRSHMTLAMLTLAVILAYVLLEVMEWARAHVMYEAGEAFDKRMRRRVFDAVFQAGAQRSALGSQQAFNDLRTVRDFFHSPSILAILEAPVALLMAVLLFLISPYLGVSALVFGTIQALVAWLNERSTKPPLMQANQTAIEAQRYADGALRDAEVIHAMGMLRSLHSRWVQRQRKFLQLHAQASQAAGGFQAVTRLVQNTLSSLLLGLGCFLLLHNDLHGGPGMMIIGSILGGRMLAPLVQVVAQWSGVVNVRDAWGRLSKLLQAVPAQAPAMPLPAPKGAVRVEQLVAGAPGSAQPIIRGAQFELQPGDVLAVVGPSAAGKTTLARLLVGLWPSMSGKVRLDGVDLYGWDKAEVGPYIGYLPQGVELFEGSVAENIARFGKPDQELVEQAARAVGLHELISSLPGGYECKVGPGGVRLSGGQRQRVALARALYGEPTYVVLDEPNSSLDEEGDAALARAIVQASARGATIVVITHRTSVLSVASKLLVMRDGQQQAFGPRDEVLAALNAASRAPAGGTLARAA